MYAKARAGEIKDFTGIGSPFEIPENYDLRVNTKKESIENCVNSISTYLFSNNFFN
jgi:adenylylsulfate kinase